VERGRRTRTVSPSSLVRPKPLRTFPCPPLASFASVSTSSRKLLLTEIFLTFITAIFPGYYTGRATHVHLRVHTEWEPLKNGTFRSHRMLHTGQLFVPDSINMQVDKVSPPSRSVAPFSTE
jgi:hypothetical protein